MLNKILMGVSLMGLSEAQALPECKKFKDIYAGGKEICENMWNGAFKYEEDEENAYTMWYFDKENPNDQVTQNLVTKGFLDAVGALPVDQCHLQYYHKPTGDAEHPVSNDDHPGQEPSDFQECHPWAKNSCCLADTVKTAKGLKEGYGEEFHWDRCGPVSPACERFFVMEACFYECEPNAGLFRRHPVEGAPSAHGDTHGLFDPDNEMTNTWQMQDMPIKASFCDSWWMACAEDLFCSTDDGDFFSCAKAYKPFVENADEGSCEGECGGMSPTGNCGCGQDCEETGTCCEDREHFCKATWTDRLYGSCQNSCEEDGPKSKSGICYCDSLCGQNGDCCDDIEEFCGISSAPVGLCDGKCGKKGKGCYCDAACLAQEPQDCCSDFAESCPIEFSSGR